MTRYVKQTDSFRCGPVALLNILKWAGQKEFWGQPVNSNLAKTILSNLCRTDRSGTIDVCFEIALTYLDNIVEIYKNKTTTLGVINKCLKDNGIILVSGNIRMTDDSKTEGHMWLIVQHEWEHYWHVNTYNNYIFKMATPTETKQMIKQARSWSIYKQE